jgi:hypothetical protein
MHARSSQRTHAHAGDARTHAHAGVWAWVWVRVRTHARHMRASLLHTNPQGFSADDCPPNFEVRGCGCVVERGGGSVCWREGGCVSSQEREREYVL